MSLCVCLVVYCGRVSFVVFDVLCVLGLMCVCLVACFVLCLCVCVCL